MSTDFPPQIPAQQEQIYLPRLEQDAQLLLTELRARTANQPLNSQALSALNQYLEQWEAHFASYLPKAQELERAGLPQLARRLTAIQKDLYGAMLQFLDMYRSVVDHERRMAGIWQAAIDDSSRMLLESINRRKAVFDECNRKVMAVLRGECPDCGHALGAHVNCSCGCGRCHVLH